MSGERRSNFDVGGAGVIDDVRGALWKAGGDPRILGTPFVHLSAGCATQGNGNARKAMQQNPLGLEPGRNRRAGAGTVNENISHAQTPVVIRSDARASRPSFGVGTTQAHEQEQPRTSFNQNKDFQN